MAFTYAVTTPSGVMTGSSSVRTLKVKEGTATQGGDATGTIVTGLSRVLVYSVQNTEVKAEDPLCKMNVDGAGAAASGSLGIIDAVDDTNNTFEWCAIGY